MIDWDERKNELRKIWNDAEGSYRIIDFINLIITQEQSMVEKLEADKSEAYNKGYADGYSDTYDYYNNPNSEKYNIIQEKLKMEK